MKLDSGTGIHTWFPLPWVVRMVKDLGFGCDFQLDLYKIDGKYYWQGSGGQGEHIVEEVTDEEEHVIDYLLNDGLFVAIPGEYEVWREKIQCYRIMLMVDVNKSS